MNCSDAPTTYKRIVPNRGCGFILSRLATRNMTKREVYAGTHYGEWRPGYHSSIWAKLLEDGLISPWNGFVDVKGSYVKDAPFWGHTRAHTRAKGHIEANGKYTVRYFITELGRQTLAKMNERLAKIREEKKAFCERNGIEFGTGRTLNTIGSVAEFDAKKDSISAPPDPIERDILEKEAVHCAKLAADYAGENQKLRAEKNDLNARLKTVADRLAKLESELASTRFALNSLIDWDK